MNRIAKTTGIIYNSLCCLSAIHPKQMISNPERQYLFYRCFMGDNGKRTKPFWDLVQTGNPDDCWEWQYKKNNFGYGYYRIEGKMFRAHRLAYELKIGPIPEGMVILHLCDNRACCNPRHLKAGTQKENMVDCNNKNRNGGFVAQGEKHGKAKLDKDKVKEIRTFLESGNYTQRAIAHLFGVSPQIISDIARHRIWKHV